MTTENNKPLSTKDLNGNNSIVLEEKTGRKNQPEKELEQEKDQPEKELEQEKNQHEKESSEEKDQSDKAKISGDFDTVVLSGGSIHSILLLGSLQYASDNNLLYKVQTYVGTSAGAICCYLLAIGYTPTEIMVYLCTKQILENMKDINIVSMINGGGGTSFSYINEQLEMMTIEKIGRLITIKELYTLFNKKFICTTYNITLGKPEILSDETYPDMPCLIALRMSCNIPFVFEKFQYLGSNYIDGGISNNFPVDIADNYGNKILGIVLYDVNKNFNETNNNTLNYLYEIMYIPIHQRVINNIENSSTNCSIFKLRTPDILFFNFNIGSQQKLEMFSSGYTQLKKQWES